MPLFLYGGYPCKDLSHKFLLAQESNAELLTKNAMPDGFEIIPLPGHFFDMVGFRTPDNIVFLADRLSSAELLINIRSALFMMLANISKRLNFEIGNYYCLYIIVFLKKVLSRMVQK